MVDRKVSIYLSIYLVKLVDKDVDKFAFITLFGAVPQPCKRYLYAVKEDVTSVTEDISAMSLFTRLIRCGNPSGDDPRSAALAVHTSQPKSPAL